MMVRYSHYIADLTNSSTAFDCGHLTSDIESGAEFVKTTAEFILSIYNEERYRVDTQDLHSAIASFEEIGHITLRGGRRRELHQ